jgi:hypothetical protein
MLIYRTNDTGSFAPSSRSGASDFHCGNQQIQTSALPVPLGPPGVAAPASYLMLNGALIAPLKLQHRANGLFHSFR